MIKDQLASIEDLELIVEIEQSAFPRSRWASEASLRNRLELWPGGTWLGLLDDTPVAFCNGFPIRDLKTQEELDPADSILFDKNGPVWLLRNVAVKNDFQGKGLGKLLVNRQIKLAKEYGASFMRFTAPNNLDSFYNSLGFEIIRPAEGFHGIEQSVWEMRL